MKKALLAAAFALPLLGTGAFAEESGFVALGGSLPVNGMTDQELATVRGGAYDYCDFCYNWAAVSQLNLSFGSLAVWQDNTSYVDQDIN